jgi:hypothetical protein
LPVAFPGAFGVGFARTAGVTLPFSGAAAAVALAGIARAAVDVPPVAASRPCAIAAVKRRCSERSRCMVPASACAWARA